LMGTFFFMFKGVPEIGAMNRAGYDVVVSGNHEFDQGVVVYANALKSAWFEVVCSNLFTLNATLAGEISPPLIKRVAGVKIGIFGLITPDLARCSNVGNDVSVSGNLVSIAKREVAGLRAEGAQLVVALTHIGTTLDEDLARHVRGIDVIVGGHTHDYLNETIPGPGGWKTIIVHAGAGGAKVGVLAFEFSNGHISNPVWETIPLLKDIGSDKRVVAYLAPYKRAYDKKLSQPVGVTEVNLDGREVTLREKESNLGDFIADSWVDWFASKGNKIDVALVNSGAIRGDYPAGNLTMKDILGMLPFGNTVYQVELTGKQLKQVLEIGASSRVVTGDGCNSNDRIHSGAFLQVSGLKFTINLKGQPFCAIYNGREVKKILSPGNRIEKPEIFQNGSWHPIDMAKTYTILVNAWMAEGGDGYYVFNQLKDKEDTTMRASDLLVSYVKEKSPVSPKVDGRIVVQP